LAFYSLVRPLLFRLDPEVSHELGIDALAAIQALPALARFLGAHFRVDDPALCQKIFGREIANPVGLAAGFDKNAAAVGAAFALGFGFAEVGTVTPRGQSGNPQPRLFRFPAAESLQNALGFNNAGARAVRRNLLRAVPFPLPVGVNLGKNRVTPADSALDDYAKLLRVFGDLADYLVINLSSPNTPGLRDLQNETFLRELFAVKRGITDRPVLAKIAPDLDPQEAARLAAVAIEAGAAGLIATNTTTDYSLLVGAKDAGGLSGRVLREKSFRLFEAVAREVYGHGLLISVGGIDSGAEAYRRLRAGASLVQIYTALVFRGPGLIGKINRELLELLARDGVKTIGEVIGVDRRNQ
jgi:dihydroorotate dehydrogenase